MIDVRDTNSLVDTTSNGEELCFSGRDINSMMTCLNDWTIVRVNVWYWGCNMIFYTGVRYNNERVRVRGDLDSDIIKFV